MPILTIDGSVLPNEVGLYRYEGEEFFSLPINVTFGISEPIEAENPLIVLVENPLDVFKMNSCILPLTSSGNILFDSGDETQEIFEESKLKDYGEVQKFTKSK